MEMNLSYTEFTENYSKCSTIDISSESKIFVYINNDKKVAVKELKYKSSGAKREIRALLACKNMGLCLQIYFYTSLLHTTWIITEYLDHYKDLFEIDFITIQNKTRVINDMIKGLEIIHSMGIAHRDIKPENIMLNAETLELKYIDFGFAELKENYEQPITFKGTICTVAPEVLKDEVTTFEGLQQTDIWSLGMTIFELLNGKSFYAVYAYGFYSRVNIPIIENVIKKDIYKCDVTFDVDYYLKDTYSAIVPIIQNMLKLNPIERKLIYIN